MKISLFLIKGNFALINFNNNTTALVETLLVSPLELCLALVVMIVSAVVFWLYERIRRMRKTKEKHRQEQDRVEQQQHHGKEEKTVHDFDDIILEEEHPQ
ncbi:MAG: hypothetical protein K2Q45_03240 [Nitrosomonas sp.]|nr:hypothetical protein [Nitrosomonas sp.]